MKRVMQPLRRSCSRSKRKTSESEWILTDLPVYLVPTIKNRIPGLRACFNTSSRGALR